MPIDITTLLTAANPKGYTGSIGYTGSQGVGYTGSIGYTGSQGVGYTGSAGSVANALTIGTGLGGSSYNGSTAVTITNTGVTSNVAGTGVAVTAATGAVTVSIGQAVATSSNVQFNSLGVGTAGSATAGEIRATNNVTAYYSSDSRLKENVSPIPDALHKIKQLQGVEFDWTQEYITAHGGEDDLFMRRHDVGVIAQDVEKVLPEVVATRPDGYLAVRYEKLVPLLLQAIKELSAQVDELLKDR